MEKQQQNGELLRFVIAALIIIATVRYFIATPFIVSGASMDATFQDDDYLIVDKISYRLTTPSRGDIIVFKYPLDPSRHHIKRIVGLPGDTISVDGAHVRISNATHPEGFELDEPYTSTHEIVYRDTKTLADDEYYVMGDNRDNSLDSRRSGPLNEKYITGRALVRLYPFTNIDILPGKFVQSEDSAEINQ